MSTQLSRDDRYESLAYQYLQRQASILNSVLNANGVKDPESRQTICSEFLFEQGVLHDQQSIETELLTAYPIVCFCEQFLDVDTSTNDLGTIFAPSPSFSFGEHAYGAVDEAIGKDTIDASRGTELSEEELSQIKGWLTTPCTITEAEDYCKKRDARGDICRTPGTWLGLLHAELLKQALPDDSLWWYKSDADTWMTIRGSMGLALVRDDRVVAFIQTGHS